MLIITLAWCSSICVEEKRMGGGGDGDDNTNATTFAISKISLTYRSTLLFWLISPLSGTVWLVYPDARNKISDRQCLPCLSLPWYLRILWPCYGCAVFIFARFVHSKFIFYGGQTFVFPRDALGIMVLHKEAFSFCLLPVSFTVGAPNFCWCIDDHLWRNWSSIACRRREHKQ